MFTENNTSENQITKPCISEYVQNRPSSTQQHLVANNINSNYSSTGSFTTVGTTFPSVVSKGYQGVTHIVAAQFPGGVNYGYQGAKNIGSRYHENMKTGQNTEADTTLFLSTTYLP